MPRGAALLELVAVMDRLRSPGGCPWDADQTHRSLATYLLEETYETLEAIDTGSAEHLREELGDLLLQVVFHARIAEERAVQPWSIDDVARGISAKLVRRHPHVFAERDAGDERAEPSTAALVASGWERSKAVEKGRTSAVEGVPFALPALSLAAKLMARAADHGVAVAVPDPGPDGDLGERLLALVAAAQRGGADPEQALRDATRRYAAAVRAAEAGAATGAGDGTAQR